MPAPNWAPASVYARLGIELGEGRGPVADWAAAHPRKEHGVHDFVLAEFGLDAAAVRDHFATYLEPFPLAGKRPTDARPTTGPLTDHGAPWRRS